MTPRVGALRNLEWEAAADRLEGIRTEWVDRHRNRMRSGGWALVSADFWMDGACVSISDGPEQGVGTLRQILKSRAKTKAKGPAQKAATTKTKAPSGEDERQSNDVLLGIQRNRG